MERVHDENEKMLFVLIPVPGRKPSRTSCPIFSGFSVEQAICSVYVTQEPGDAAKIAEEYGKDVELFVCSGGDGTAEQRDLRHHEAGKTPGDRISPGRFHE